MAPRLVHKGIVPMSVQVMSCTRVPRVEAILSMLPKALEVNRLWDTGSFQVPSLIQAIY